LDARNYSLNIILETDAMVLVAIEKLTIAFSIPSGLSLGLIGNAAGKVRCAVLRSIRGVFDKQARRKPLAFAAGAGNAAGYGI
jgi:hypothetical protein